MSRYRLLMGYASGALAALVAIGALATGWQHREWTKTPEHFDMPPLSPGGPPIRLHKGADGRLHGEPIPPDTTPKPGRSYPADFVFYNVGGVYMEGKRIIPVLGVISALLAAAAVYLLRRPQSEFHRK